MCSKELQSWYKASHTGSTKRLEYLGLIRLGLERRRVRSDLVESFRIMIGHYGVHHDLWFELDEVDRRGHDQKLFRRQFRLDSKNLCSVIELLITESHFLHTVSILC